MSTTDETATDIVRPWRTALLPPLVDLVVACEILGVTKATLYRWMKEGYMLEAAQAGRKPIWVREDVERFTEQYGRVRSLAGEHPRYIERYGGRKDPEMVSRQIEALRRQIAALESEQDQKA
jgi:predicted DNA-binding transcriptional regulator AlpA